MATPRAVSDVILVELSKSDALPLLMGEPQLLYEAARVLSARLRATDFVRINDLERKNEELAQANLRLNESYEATPLMLSNTLDLRD